MLRATLAALLAILPTLAGAGTALVTRPDTLRENPSSFAFGMADVHRRSTVQVLEVRGEWVRVEIAGNRSGWIRRDSTDLDMQPDQSTPAPPASSPREGTVLPRSIGRAGNHALMLTLTPPSPTGQNLADAANASRIAALMGVPDANTRYLAGEALTLDGLRQALADLDGRVGEHDRVFIHISADGAQPRGGRACGDALLTTDRQLFTASELHRHLLHLAARTDKVFVVIDAGRGEERAAVPGQRNRFTRQIPPDAVCTAETFDRSGLPANVQILLVGHQRAAFEDEHGGLATQALRACFEGQAPAPGDPGLADGDALRACAQTRLDRMPGRQRMAVAGNPALIPAPLSWTSTPSGKDAPRRLLEAIHAQRDQRRKLDIVPIRSADGAAAVRLASDRPGHLYILQAGENGFTLLHPNQHSTDRRLEPGTTINLPALTDGASLAGSRLLFLLTDSARSPQRAGFVPSGPLSVSFPDARGLRLATEEFLGGDTRPLCRFSETRNLGADQLRQCSTAFAAKWISFPPASVPR